MKFPPVDSETLENIRSALKVSPIKANTVVRYHVKFAEGNKRRGFVDRYEPTTDTFVIKTDDGRMVRQWAHRCEVNIDGHWWSGDPVIRVRQMADKARVDGGGVLKGLTIGARECRVCGGVIESTGTRGRPRETHRECMDKENVA